MITSDVNQKALRETLFICKVTPYNKSMIYIYNKHMPCYNNFTDTTYHPDVEKRNSFKLPKLQFKETIHVHSRILF